MPKHGFLTPKAISNRIKAKGLQKLRWYCEMCQKQCRDENGFKCHQTSEGHLRQMRIFAESPEAVMKEYSEAFEKEFLDILSRRHGTKRVRAALVYNEFIANKTHTHMNATQWETLTSFVLYLGKAGSVVADETEKGWYVQWIDRDPRLLAMQEAAARRQKEELDDEEKQARVIEEQIKAARARDESRGHTEEESAGSSELRREEGQGAFRIGLGSAASLGAGAGGGGPKGLKRPRLASAFGEDDEVVQGANATTGDSVSIQGHSKGKGKRSMIETLMQQEQAKKSAEMEKGAAGGGLEEAGEGAGVDAGKGERKDYWLRAGIVVKIMNKKVGGGKYYKKKARLRKVVERYIGEVKMLDSGDRLRIDQEDLETVIPAVGGEVFIVNGPCRGCRATLVSLDTEGFCASVRVTSQGPDHGRELDRVEYEDICKAVPEDEG